MNATPPGDDTPDWMRALRDAFGDNADAVVEQLRAAGFDPAQLPGGDASLNPQMMQAALRQVQQFLSVDAPGGINADMARDVARQFTTTQGPDPSLTPAQRRAVEDAFRIAELWLDAATTIPPPVGRPLAWSRAEWIEGTIATWSTLTAPVAQAVVEALTGLFRDEFPESDNADGFYGAPPELAGLMPGIAGLGPDALLRRVGSAVYGMQVGQGTGELAMEVFGTTDVGVPLAESQVTAMVVTNVEAFARDLSIEESEVRVFLALREAAATRLFAGVPWLRAHVLGIIDQYARGVTIDPEALESTMQGVDPMNPDALRSALSSGIFAIPATEQQQATLLRLETVLALIEGWVDAVSAQAALPHLPSLVALREMMRRRRAAGGPAEQTFATIVGLELRPRRARDATALWELLGSRMNAEARDQVWDHPDLLPTSDDLDNPVAFVQRRSEDNNAITDEIDAALGAILDAAENEDGGETQSPS